jgi:hypothetical protein
MEIDFKGKRALVTGAGKGKSMILFSCYLDCNFSLKLSNHAYNFNVVIYDLCVSYFIISQIFICYTFVLLLTGIGRSTAKALAQGGAEVIALTRSQSDLDSLVAEV